MIVVQSDLAKPLAHDRSSIELPKVGHLLSRRKRQEAKPEELVEILAGRLFEVLERDVLLNLEIGFAMFFGLGR